MMDLHDALNHIAEIRMRMAEAEIFRGYRALPVAISGAIAFAFAAVQAASILQPADDVRGYVLLWTVAAGLSLSAVGAAMGLRDHFGGASRTRAVTWLALSQFAPCLLAGVLVTVAIVRALPDHAALLPGLWQMFFSLGVFASCRLLPRAVFGVGLWYLFAGAATLALARGEFAFSPWAMAVPFGVGQLATAGILYWNLERQYEPVA